MQAGFALAGRYVLEQLLGQGTVGEVWRATDRELGRPVAVKVIGERIADPKLAAGLLGEARIAGRLQHPGLTAVHDTGEHEGQPFIVMELLHGRDLGAVLEDFPGGMPVDEAVSLAVQAAAALAAALRELQGRPGAAGTRAAPDRPAGAPGGAQRPSGSAGPDAAPRGTAGSPDGPVTGSSRQLLATAGNDSAVRLWDPATGQQVAVLEGHERGINAMCPVTVGGRQLLATAGRDRAVRLWDPATGLGVATLEGHERKINAVCPVTTGGRHLLATAGRDRAVRLWDPATRQQVAVLRGHEHGINAMCPVTTGGRQLLATGGGDGTVRLWDPATGQQAAVLRGHEGPVSTICAVTIGGRQLLATGGGDGAVRLWDPATGQQAAVLREYRGAVETICAVTVGGRPLLAFSRFFEVSLWDPASGQQSTEMRGDIHVGDPGRYGAGLATLIGSVTVGGRPLLATATNGTVRLWDPAGQRVLALHGHRGVNAVCSVTVSFPESLATVSGSPGHAR